MNAILNPAAEFDYSPRVQALFANLKHAGSLPVAGSVGAARDRREWFTHELPSGAEDIQKGVSRTAPTQMGEVLSVSAGSHEQGASVRLYIHVQNGQVQTMRYQAYGCPHFLAACESLAQWLEGRALSALAQWRWRDVEAELAIPANKRSRLLLLDEALSALRKV